MNNESKFKIGHIKTKCGFDAAIIKITKANLYGYIYFDNKNGTNHVWKLDGSSLNFFKDEYVSQLDLIESTNKELPNE